MGLSGRKAKQRIPNDPRNLCWADDAARFGSNYLTKFGWDGTTGLGVTGEGRTSHIKVSHKLDLLGIGAAQQKDLDGIAWKQNKDFERLLQRLNDASAAENNQTLESRKEEEENNQANHDTCITEKKRKHREDGESKTGCKKKKRKADTEIDHEYPNAESATIQPEKIETTVVEVKKAAIIPRHRAHRARAINAKNISSKSAAHISEILGIVPIPSRSSSGIDSRELLEAQGKLTSLTDEVVIEKITTSTKSVADYFKEKLKARSLNAIVSTSTTPRDYESDYSYDTPRMGLGSRARLENSTVIGELGQETQNMGLSNFSAFSSSLARPKDPDLEDPATMAKMDADSNPHTVDLERQKKKNEETGEDGAREAKEKERKKRKRKKKLDKGGKDTVVIEPQDSDDSKQLKKLEKRKRKEENLHVLVTSPITDTPVDEACVKKRQKERKEKKKGSQANRDEHTKVHVS